MPFDFAQAEQTFAWKVKPKSCRQKVYNGSTAQSLAYAGMLLGRNLQWHVWSYGGWWYNHLFDLIHSNTMIELTTHVCWVLLSYVLYHDR